MTEGGGGRKCAVSFNEFKGEETSLQLTMRQLIKMKHSQKQEYKFKAKHIIVRLSN